ncbi:hypothetical protein D3C86_1498370 [compost metagenome]
MPVVLPAVASPAVAKTGTGSRRMRSDQSFRTRSQAPNSATMAKLAISIACVALVMVMEVPRSTSQAAPTRPMAIKP